MSQKTFVVLMGPPGAGKGTQAKLLEQKIGLPQVATGDLFRANLKQETDLGKLAKSYMDKGELVPDTVTVDMVRDRLQREDCAKGAILDGFPRNPAQAEKLDELLKEFDGRLNTVIFIHVEESILISRLLDRAIKEGRADDNEETIRTRMNVYREQTAPLLDHYQARDLLVQIDGDRIIDDVFADMTRIISEAS